MKKIAKIIGCITILFVGISCSKTEAESNEEPIAITAITLDTSALNAIEGTTVNFTITSNLGTNLNDNSLFFVNDVAIASSSYTFSNAGTYTIKAEYANLTSNLLTINITNTPVVSYNFVHKTLLEEFSGTWCGNCPRILYGIDLVHQQTNKTVSVGIHLFGNDPFITNDGNNLAATMNVNEVPTGKINRTVNWSGPQYQNINQVLNEIQPAADLGLGIDSTRNGNSLAISILIGVKENLPANSKLTVYLVEDHLFHTQANYSSALYGGLSTIPNFEYNGVLRGIVSNINGENLSFSGTEFQRNFSYTLPSSIANLQNVRIVAFVTGSNGKAINVQEANIEENQMLEKL